MNIVKNKVTTLGIEDGEVIRPKFALVYQAGLANLFKVNCFNLSCLGREAIRIYQGDFSTAEAMAEGAGQAGATIMTFACNMAGDIINQKWSEDLEAQPFSDNFSPVFYTVGC